MKKTKDNETNNNIDKKYQLFSNVANLLKYRDQVVSDANYHSSELVTSVKYYTTLISALFSLLITITIASFKLFSDNLLSNNLFLYIILTIIFTFLPIIIIILSGVALENSERLYRRTMEYVSIKMKIDEILGIHDPNIYFNLREKFQLKLFSGDISFANSRWEERDSSWHSIPSEEFVDYLTEKKTAGYGLFSRVFKIFKYSAYAAFFIIIFTLILLPFINHLHTL